MFREFRQPAIFNFVSGTHLCHIGVSLESETYWQMRSGAGDLERQKLQRSLKMNLLCLLQDKSWALYICMIWEASSQGLDLHLQIFEVLACERRCLFNLDSENRAWTSGYKEEGSKFQLNIRSLLRQRNPDMKKAALGGSGLPFTEIV